MKHYFETILKMALSADKETLAMSLDNVHAMGLFSLVIKGNEPGKLLRVFMASKKVKPFDVQLHTHRYGIELTCIKGDVVQHVAYESDDFEKGVLLSEFGYRSPLNGGEGLYYIKERKLFVEQFHIPQGGTIKMDEESIHTISCSAGSIWIVQELGFETEESKVYGLPFALDGLYQKPSMFQLNDRLQIFVLAIKEIILNYLLNDNNNGQA